mgnify:CR=1 FL=1
MTDQLTFDWPNGVSLGAEDFFVSQANAQAYAMLQAPDSWPERKLVLVGPSGCGKSHLARIGAAGMQGQICDSSALPDQPQNGGFVIVEDMDRLPNHSQEAMFHLHNHLRHTGGLLLMTAQTAPSRWPITLPDLASRMQATTIVTINAPDDALLQALLMKLFADRQLNIGGSVIPYLAKRIERSYDAAVDIVAALDRAALAEGVAVTTKLAARLLDNGT